MNVDEALIATIRTPITHQVTTLITSVGTTLTAYFSGARTRQLPAKWALGIIQPRTEARRRLGLAHACWLTLDSVEGADTARAWFIGANPWLGDRSPSTVIRESSENVEVLAALRAFIDDAVAGA